MDFERIPNHIAIIMDGNGRWAESKSLPRLAGHNAGMEALKEIVKHSSSLGVKHLTVYAFSTENWRRPENEIIGIFRILIYYINKELQELHNNNVKVSILGDYEKLPKDAVNKLKQSLEKTKNNTGLNFHIALNYGSRNEILRAMNNIVKEIQRGTMLEEKISEKTLEDYMYTAGIPDPDLIIRTGGEQRLSNFLLWQVAYSEFVFTEIFWPDFTPQCLENAIIEFQSRVRRFGGIK